MSQGGANTIAGSGGSPVETITGNSGGPIAPNGAFNINLVGNTSTGINIVGNAALHTLTVMASQATTAQFGTVLLATNAQAIAGTDTNNAITADDLKAKLGTQTLHGVAIGAGTTSALSWTGTGNIGQILTSNGPAADPTFQANAAISTINGDIGSVSGATVTFNGLSQAGQSVSFSGSGATMAFNTTDSNNALTGQNTFIGLTAGKVGYSKYGNTALGYAALSSITAGYRNTVIGASAGAATGLGFDHVLIGYQAGKSLNLSSNSTTIIGANAGTLITNNADNTIIGANAYTAGTGNNNVVIGSSAMVAATGGASKNVVIGYSTGNQYTTTESSNILLSSNGITGDSNVIRIGTQGNNPGRQNTCYIAGITGVTVSNPVLVTLNSSTGQLGNIASANRAVLTSDGSGVPVLTPLATNGQLIIGSTAGVPAAAFLSAGSGIAITNGSNSITIAATGAGFAWSDTSGAFAAAAENGYFITATATGTLPASPIAGDTIAFIVDTAQLLTIQANTGQKIRIGASISSVAGTMTSAAQGDSVELVYRATDTTWISLGGPQGTWTPT